MWRVAPVFDFIEFVKDDSNDEVEGEEASKYNESNKERIHVETIL